MPITRAASMALAQSTLPPPRTSGMDVDGSSWDMRDMLPERAETPKSSAPVDEEEAKDEAEGKEEEETKEKEEASPCRAVKELEKELAVAYARVEEVEYEVREELTEIMEGMLVKFQREKRELEEKKRMLRAELEASKKREEALKKLLQRSRTSDVASKENARGDRRRSFAL